MRGTFLLLVALVACGGDDDSAGRVDAIVALDGDAAAGRAVYDSDCASCHGLNGEGGVGPSLVGTAEGHDAELLASIILDGTGDMPAHDYLDDQEIADVIAFLEADTW